MEHSPHISEECSLHQCFQALKCDVIKFSIFAFQHFHDNISVEHDEKPSHNKFDMNWFMGPKIWPHEYLISPIEISVTWPGS